KRIDFVRIGRSAMGLAGMIKRLGAGPGMGETAGMPTGSEGSATAPGGGTADAGTAAPGGSATDGAGGMEQLLGRDPAEGRYVDDKYKRLEAARLRSALKSTTPEDALLAVAKRMPVRIRVSIDQRRLNLLLAQCGNSNLPVEVRQVRINCPAAPVS